MTCVVGQATELTKHGAPLSPPSSTPLFAVAQRRGVQVGCRQVFPLRCSLNRLHSRMNPLQTPINRIGRQLRRQRKRRTKAEAKAKDDGERSMKGSEKISERSRKDTCGMGRWPLANLRPDVDLVFRLLLLRADLHPWRRRRAKNGRKRLGKRSETPRGAHEEIIFPRGAAMHHLAPRRNSEPSKRPCERSGVVLS